MPAIVHQPNYCETRCQALRDELVFGWAGAMQRYKPDRELRRTLLKRTSENAQNANFAFTAFSEVREFGVSRKFVSKVSRTIHFGGCTARSGAVTLGATTPAGKGGELDEGNCQGHLRPTRSPGT